MIQRNQVEQILRINGVSETAEDEEIKSVLLSARWHEDDVETAMMVLRENVNDHKTHVDTIHQVFHTDQRLSPESVTSLLGIEMDVTSEDIKKHKRNADAHMRLGKVALLAFVTLIFSLIILFAFMWYAQVGIFHISHTI